MFAMLTGGAGLAGALFIAFCERRCGGSVMLLPEGVICQNYKARCES